MYPSKHLLLCSCALIGVASGAEAQERPALAAQTPAAATQDRATEGQLEEIIVTAQKRSELLSKAPLAISVVSQQALDKQGITSASGLIGTVPNLQSSVNGFSIRGIGSNNYTSVSFSTVALQVDGIYNRNLQTLALGMYDIDRIEVLRGPQGTVYGKNATAGVVNINTADPKQTYATGFDVAGGTEDDVTARAYLNVPLSDTFALRASFARRKNDGYDSGGMGQDDYGIIDQTSARLTALWTPLDQFSWRVSLAYGSNEGTVDQTKTIGYYYYPNANQAAGTLGQREFVATSGNVLLDPGTQDNRLDDHETAVRSKMVWELSDKLSLTYLAGYSDFENDDVAPSSTLFTFGNQLTTNSYSHELDLNYSDENTKAILGAYYYHDDNSGYAVLHLQDVAPFPFNNYFNLLGPSYRGVGTEPSIKGAVDILGDSSDGLTSESTAVFGQVTRNLRSDLRLTGGVRYTEDEMDLSSQLNMVCLYNTAVKIPPLTCGAPLGPPQEVGLANVGSSNTSWKVTVDYDVAPNILAYATVGTGYRGGGVGGGTAPPQYQSFDPETVTNYEAGVRALLFDRRISLNLTAFNMEYEDLQVGVYGTDLVGQPTVFIANAARAKIPGLEFEGAWQITPRDTLTGFATYLDAEVSSFPAAADNPNAAGVLYNILAPIFGAAAIPTPVADYSGNKLPNAPEESMTIRYAHEFQLAGGATLTPSVVAAWQSKSFPDVTNVPETQRDSFWKTDLNLRFLDRAKRFSIDAFVYNVEDDRTITSATATWAVVTATYSPPRTYGVRLGYRY